MGYVSTAGAGVSGNRFILLNCLRTRRPKAMKSEGDRPTQIGDRIARALDNPWIVLALLFFVFAGLGIPLIWISKAFSTSVKIILTIALTLYTVLLLWIVWLILLWSYSNYIEFTESL